MTEAQGEGPLKRSLGFAEKGWGGAAQEMEQLALAARSCKVALSLQEVDAFEDEDAFVFPVFGRCERDGVCAELNFALAAVVDTASPARVLIHPVGTDGYAIGRSLKAALADLACWVEEKTALGRIADTAAEFDFRTMADDEIGLDKLKLVHVRILLHGLEGS